jgi:hypothetical protein
MNTLELLTSARALITDPGRWVQGIREMTMPDGTLSFCALGALDEALQGVSDNHPAVSVLAQSLTPDERLRAARHIKAVWSEHETVCDGGLVAQFNNTGTHAEVLSLFDRAIDRQRTIEGMKDAPQAELAPVVGFVGA